MESAFSARDVERAECGDAGESPLADVCSPAAIISPNRCPT
jgi:hypothetical protein